MAEHKSVNMEKKPGISPELYTYIIQHSLRERDEQKALREKTLTLPNFMMQGAPDEAQLFQFLLKLTGAKKAVEVGVFTGYTTLALALALPEDGKVVACDITDEYLKIGKPFWAQAGVAHKIDVRIGPATDTLEKLLNEGQENSFDFAFIDADKTNYPAYYEKCLKLIRRGGIIAIDNVLFHGSVVDPTNTDENTVAIRQLNDCVFKDERVDISMLGIADGVTLCRKL